MISVNTEIQNNKEESSLNSKFKRKRKKRKLQVEVVVVPAGSLKSARTKDNTRQDFLNELAQAMVEIVPEKKVNDEKEKKA